MKEIILTSRQQMLSPDQFSYEMGLIPTPEKMEMNRKVTYLLIGGAVTITLMFSIYNIYTNYQEKKKYTSFNLDKKHGNLISDNRLSLIISCYI